MSLKPAGVRLVAEGATGFFSTLGKATASVAAFGKEGEKSSSLLSKLGAGALGIGKVLTGALVGGIGATAAGLGFAAKEAISLESAFAGVIKTTDGLTDSSGQLTDIGREMQDGFRNLAKEVPIAIEELMGIGELGGQLGIARDDLIDFTDTIAAVGVATNLTTEDAAVGFAQMANIMGTPTSEIENMASSLVALGNNMATTESDIFNFATNIAGAGNIAGLTEAQVLGIGAAFSSVGIEAAAGGTATQKVLLGINEAVLSSSDNLDIFAQTAGMSSEDFASAWEVDAGGAFNEFVMGLGAAGDDAVGILGELGLQDQRLIKSFLSLAGAGDLLTDAMDLSSKAFEENSALTKEAEARYRTTESQLTIFKNSLRDVGFTVGSAVLPFLNQMLEGLKPVIEQVGRVLPEIINTYVIPALTQMGEWLGDVLPVAMETLSGFFAEKWPMIQEILSNFWETAQPILLSIVSWFTSEGPGALSTLQEIFSTVWNEIYTIFQTVWVILQPALQSLFDYLAVFIPEAIQIAKEFWEGTLLPALTLVWEFISTVLIPVIAQIAAWFIEHIPAAIEIVKEYWENVLLPAMTIVWEFISGTLIPIFETAVLWLSENIPVAIDTARQYWEEVLKPAIEVVWGFIDEYLIPIFNDVWTIISETLRIAVEGMALLWESTLKPALEKVWSFIQGDLLPIFRTIGEFITDTLGPKIESFLHDYIEPLSDGLSTLKGWLEKIKGWIDKLAAAVESFSWGNLEGAMPGSLPPLALGFKLITGEVDKFQSQVSQMETGLQSDIFGNMSGILQPESVTPLGANMAPVNNTVNNERSVTINFEGNYASQPAIRDRNDLSFVIGAAGVLA